MRSSISRSVAIVDRGRRGDGVFGDRDRPVQDPLPSRLVNGVQCRMLLLPTLGLAACVRIATIAETTGPESDEWPLLVRNGAVEADRQPVSPNSIGRRVIVKGFARTNDGGAAVVRERSLVYCVDRSAWGVNIEGQWVRVEGVLWTTNHRGSETILDGQGALRPVARSFVVETCQVTAGATDEDVPRDQWVLLAATEEVFAQSQPHSLGNRVTVRGRLAPNDEQILLYTSTLVFRLACPELRNLAAGSQVTVTGALGFVPALYLPDAPPFPYFVSSPPQTGTFVIASCEVSQ